MARLVLSQQICALSKSQRTCLSSATAVTAVAQIPVKISVSLENETVVVNVNNQASPQIFTAQVLQPLSLAHLPSAPCHLGSLRECAVRQHN